MTGYLIIAGIAAVAVLATLTYIFRINILPVIAVGLITVFGVNPLVYGIGSEIAKDQSSSFNEYWNGYETQAVRKDTACTRDSGCSHTYDCDPYTVIVMKSRSVPDGKGGTKSESYPDTETRYHSCPYSTQESDFIIKSTVDTYTVASNLMTGDQYRGDQGIPGGKVTQPPAAWTEAKQRIDSGKPGPVTAVKEYKNYILASQKTLFKAYANNIEDFKAKGLLPALSKGVVGMYHANKAYKVGDVNLPSFNDLATDVEYLNGAVGNNLHGDLHVVFVPENIEGGKDDYLNTLTAYWQSEELGRDAISKNAIIVVIGVSADGSKVAWAKATTGMPMGNEAMLTQIGSDLKGKAIDSNLIGRPTYKVDGGTVVHSSGALENVLWGQNAFTRISMSGGNANDNGSGFKYLRDELEPNGWQVFGIAASNFLVAGLLIMGFIFLVINDVLPTKIVRWKGSDDKGDRYDPVYAKQRGLRYSKKYNTYF